MSDCKECGFGADRGDGFCGDICRIFWSRRTTDPAYWTNIPRAAAIKKEMTEETKEKLREYNDKKKAARHAELLALQADEANALTELQEAI